MADKNKKPGIWQTLERFVLMGRISERRLAEVENRLARFDGGLDADASIVKFVAAENAEHRRLYGAATVQINPKALPRG